MSCPQVMSARKRATRDAYYGALRYVTMCVSGAKSTNICFFHHVIFEEFVETFKLTQTVRKSESHG